MPAFHLMNDAIGTGQHFTRVLFHKRKIGGRRQVGMRGFRHRGFQKRNISNGTNRRSRHNGGGGVYIIYKYELKSIFFRTKGLTP